MTRARDSLILYGKQGTGKDKTPPGLTRELLKNPALRPCGCNARPGNSRPNCSGMPLRRLRSSRAPPSGWPCRQRFPLNRLSATAVESYESARSNSSSSANGESRATFPRQCTTALPCTACSKLTYESIRLERPLSEEECSSFFGGLRPGGDRRSLPAGTVRAAGSPAVAGLPEDRRQAAKPQRAAHRGAFRDQGREAPRSRAASTGSTIWGMAGSPSSTTRRASRARKRMPTRACSSRSTRWRRAKSGAMRPSAWCSTTSRKTARSLRVRDSAATGRSEGQGGRCGESDRGGQVRSQARAITAASALTAICAPPPEKPLHNACRSKQRVARQQLSCGPVAKNFRGRFWRPPFALFKANF